MKLNLKWIVDNKKNLLFYFLGLITLGFGVNIMKASDLGAGAWDTVTINIRSFMQLNLNQDWVSLGMVSFTISFILMIIVMLYRKEAKFLWMIVPILLVSVMIDFWNIILFHDRLASSLYFQVPFYIAGSLLLPLGLAFVVKSGFPAFVFDELMLMFVKIFHAKKITFVRIVIEFTGILIGTIFGFLSMYPINGGLGAVNYGSVLFAFTLSPIMTVYYKIFKIKRDDSIVPFEDKI